MPKWLREIVSDLRAIAATGMVFVAASVVGFFVAVKLASGQPWIGIIAARGVSCPHCFTSALVVDPLASPLKPHPYASR